LLLRLLAILALLAVVAYLGLSSTARNQGEFTYALDDTYIHLAVAQNLATNGVWGINPNDFTPVTSSLIWPLLLVALGVAAPWGIWVPLVLNIFIAIAVLWIADRWMIEQRVSWLVRGGVLAGLVLVAPLGVLTILGLEHVLQTGLALLLLRWGIERSDGAEVGRERYARGIILAALLVATRFEGIFLVVSIAWWMRRARRQYEAALLLLAGLAPIVVFGGLNLLLGERFLPTPIWMKGKLASELLPVLRDAGSDPALWFQFGLEFLVLGPLRNLAEVGVLAWMVLFGLARLIWSQRTGTRLVALAILLVTTWLHLTFARTGWLGRYEAWLIAMFAVVLAPTAQRVFDLAGEGRWNLRILAPIALVMFGLFPVRARVASTMFQANRGSTNIYEQQVQMARFLGEFRYGEPIALNDIGAVAYYAGVEVVDLWGLANVEIAQLRLSGRLNPIEVDWEARTRGVEVAAMYEFVLEESGGMPAEWEPIVDWKIHRNAVCGSSKLTWYATTASAAARLREELQAWSPKLPPTVDVQWR
jgi:hypothetical protein